MRVQTYWNHGLWIHILFNSCIYLYKFKLYIFHNGDFVFLTGRQMLLCMHLNFAGTCIFILYSVGSPETKLLASCTNWWDLWLHQIRHHSGVKIKPGRGQRQYLHHKGGQKQNFVAKLPCTGAMFCNPAPWLFLLYSIGYLIILAPSPKLPYTQNGPYGTLLWVMQSFSFTIHIHSKLCRNYCQKSENYFFQDTYFMSLLSICVIIHK